MRALGEREGQAGAGEGGGESQGSAPRSEEGPPRSHSQGPLRGRGGINLYQAADGFHSHRPLRWVGSKAGLKAIHPDLVKYTYFPTYLDIDINSCVLTGFVSALA